MGVTSRMSEILRPAAEIARSADSRPAPGPDTWTVTDFSPCSIAFAAASPAATCAANGVDLREPLKPRAPADDQLITFPETSAIVIIVLLKDAFMWTPPAAMFFFTRFFPFFGVTGEAVMGSMPPRFRAPGAGGAPRLCAGAGA